MYFQIKRIIGYMLGFILFYAPGALFTKAIFYLFGRDINEISIHSSCFRIQIEHLLDGKFFAMDIAFVSFLVVYPLKVLFFVGNFVQQVQVLNI